MSTKITYNGKTTELADGYIATFPCKDFQMETDVVVEAPEPDVPSKELNLISKTVTANGTYKASEEVDDSTIIGTWYLNETLTSKNLANAHSPNSIDYDGDFQAINLTTNKLYTYNQFDYVNDSDTADRLYYHQWNDWVDIMVYQNGKWVSDEYRTIVIDREPSSSSEIEPMLNWLKANATKVTVDGYSEVIVNVKATDSPLPIEVSTEAEMTALLESGEVGGVYKYTGTTDTYENGALYVLENDLITFTIDGTEYEAESGMAWVEWVNSEYNTGVFACSSNTDYVTGDSGRNIRTSANSTIIKGGDYITASETYIYNTSSGGGV